eukprot:9059122-Pyramimonas_sp.AAC.1
MQGSAANIRSVEKVCAASTLRFNVDESPEETSSGRLVVHDLHFTYPKTSDSGESNRHFTYPKTSDSVTVIA